MYIAAGQGQITPGDKILMSTETSCHYKFQKKLWSLILYIFSWFYQRGRGRQPPWGQNFDVNRKALSFYPFVASFKEISLKSDFIHFFHDLIHAYSPGEVGIQSPGDKVWCQQKRLVTSIICCYFQNTDDNNFWKIHCSFYFPIKKHKGPNLTLP